MTTLQDVENARSAGDTELTLELVDEYLETRPHKTANEKALIIRAWALGVQGRQSEALECWTKVQESVDDNVGAAMPVRIEVRCERMGALHNTGQYAERDALFNETRELLADLPASRRGQYQRRINELAEEFGLK